MSSGDLFGSTSNRAAVDARPAAYASPSSGPSDLADILERVLDKGIVIAGDIQINLLDIELLTIKLRLLVASVDKAREMGINWWEGDPTLQRVDDDQQSVENGEGVKELERENAELRERLDRLERLIEE